MTSLREKYRPSDEFPILQKYWDKMKYQDVYRYSKEFEKIDVMMEKEYKKIST